MAKSGKESKVSNEWPGALGFPANSDDNALDNSTAVYVINQIRAQSVLPPAVLLSGDHIWKVTPVPIPNTVVKLPEPMIVLQA